MRTSTIIVYLSLLIFIAGLSFCVKLMSVYIIKQRARKFEVYFNTTTAQELMKMGCVSTDFFHQCSLFFYNHFNIDILDLGYHYIAGGNLNAVLSGLLFARNNQIQMSYFDICILDLSNKDITSELSKICQGNDEI